MIEILKNPYYADAYIYGKTVHRTNLVEGRVRKTDHHVNPVAQWGLEWRTTTKNISIESSTSATIRRSRRKPIPVPGVSSRDVAAERFFRGS